MPLPPGRYCSAPQCHNNRRDNPDLSFFTFPLDEIRCQTWIQNAGRTDLVGKSAQYCRQNLQLCADHFERPMFMNPLRKSLIKSAVPTRFPDPRRKSPSPTPILRVKHPRTLKRTYPWRAKPVPNQHQSNVPTPTRIRHPIKKINPQRKRIIRIKNRAIRVVWGLEKKTQATEAAIGGLKAYLRPDEHRLVSLQMKGVMSRTHQYKNSEFKACALSLCIQSPTNYEFLQSRFRLPPIDTLLDWTTQLKVESGFCDNLIKLLSLKTRELREKDRVCSLILGQIPLKAVAEEGLTLTKAMVLMVTGLKMPWRQPLAYFLTSHAMPAQSLVARVKKALETLWSIGLLPVVVVTEDQSFNFVAMSRDLGITESHPYFEHGGQKIMVMVDTPHLLKSTRNCLLTHRITSNTGTAQWEHINEAFKNDSHQKIKSCPNLNENHFNSLDTGGKRDMVQLTSEVFSSSVAAAIFTQATFHLLPMEAQQTADFVEKMSIIFNVLNSDTQDERNQDEKKALQPGSSDLKVLDEMFQWIHSWIIKDSTGEKVNPKFSFVNGLLENISAVRSLVKVLRQDYGFQCLCTKRLNSEPLDSFFIMIRDQEDLNQNPYGSSFEQAFKEVTAKVTLTNDESSRNEDSGELCPLNFTEHIKLSFESSNRTTEVEI